MARSRRAAGRTPSGSRSASRPGTRVFTALYQGRPSPDQGNVWQRQWWRRYREPLWSQHPDVPDAYLVHECDEVVMSWDMAFKDTKSSDFVAGQVWARRGADVYLLDQVHKRLSFTDTLTAFTALVARWPQATPEAHRGQGQRHRGHRLAEVARSPASSPVTPHESKYARANAVARSSRPATSSSPARVALFDAEALIDEAAAFPNAAHDDQVDAASQALAELLLDGTGAQAWIAWAQAERLRRRSQAAKSPSGRRGLRSCQRQPCQQGAGKAHRSPRWRAWCLTR